MAEKRNSWKEILSEKLAGSLAKYILSDVELKVRGDINHDVNNDYSEDNNISRLVHSDGKGSFNFTVSFERKLKD